MKRHIFLISITSACCCLLLSLPIISNLPFGITEAYEAEDPNAPSVSIDASLSGATITVTWDSENVVDGSITVSGDGVSSGAPSGSENIAAEAERSYTFTIKATGLDGGDYSDSVSITYNPTWCCPCGWCE